MINKKMLEIDRKIEESTAKKDWQHVYDQLYEEITDLKG